MDIGAILTTAFTTWYTYLIIMVLLAMGIGTKWLRRARIKKRTAYMLLGLGIFLTVFGVGWLGVGTVGSGVGGVDIQRIQTTTAFNLENTNGTPLTIADSGIDDTRMSDFYPSETDVAGNAYIHDGVFAVTRGGELSEASCPVRVIKPPRYDISDTTYHIVDEDADTGVMYAYIATASTSTPATASHPKEVTELAFDRGVSVGYVGFNITIDETGFDPLTQYVYKDINVDICGYPYTFRVHKADA